MKILDSDARTNFCVPENGDFLRRGRADKVASLVVHGGWRVRKPTCRPEGAYCRTKAFGRDCCYIAHGV